MKNFTLQNYQQYLLSKFRVNQSAGLLAKPLNINLEIPKTEQNIILWTPVWCSENAYNSVSFMCIRVPEGKCTRVDITVIPHAKGLATSQKLYS